MDNRRIKDAIIVASIEGCLVLVGVLLAFFVENLREDQERVENLVRDLKMLSIELTENHEMTTPSMMTFLGDQLSYLDSIEQKIEVMDKEQLDKVKADVLGFYGNTETRPYALDLMINNGTFSLIKGEELTMALIIDLPAQRSEVLRASEQLVSQVIDKELAIDEIRKLSNKKIEKSRESFSAFQRYFLIINRIDSLIMEEIALNE